MSNSCSDIAIAYDDVAIVLIPRSEEVCAGGTLCHADHPDTSDLIATKK